MFSEQTSSTWTKLSALKGDKSRPPDNQNLVFIQSRLLLSLNKTLEKQNVSHVVSVHLFSSSEKFKENPEKNVKKPADGTWYWGSLYLFFVLYMKHCLLI